MDPRIKSEDDGKGMDGVGAMLAFQPPIR